MTITDSSGNPCYVASYTPYGQEMATTNTCPQNYKFTGYERDSETGLDYAFARYYNPRLGRFMSPDPLGGGISDPQTLNRYAYVRNNATDLIDPSGMQQRPPGWEQDNVVTFYLHDSLWENWDVFDFLSAAARGQITGPKVAQYPEFLEDVTPVNAGDYIGLTAVVGNFVYNVSSVDEFGIMGPGTAVGWVNVFQSALGGVWFLTNTQTGSLAQRGHGPSPDDLRLQQFANLLTHRVSTKGIFQLWGLSVVTGAGGWGVFTFRTAGWGWVLAHGQDVGNCLVGALSPVPGGRDFGEMSAALDLRRVKIYIMI